MLDINLCRKETDRVNAALAKRGVGDIHELLKIDSEYRTLLADLETLNQKKNQANTEMVQLKKAGQDVTPKINEMKEVSSAITEAKKRVEVLAEEIKTALLHIPNLPSDDTPDGDASNNQIVKEWGSAESPGYPLKNHLELGESLDILDFERATKLSGSSFILFKRDGARLERALIQFMLDLHTEEHDYTEVAPPFMVRRQCMEGTGQLPKFEFDMYRIFRGNAEDEAAGPQESDMFLIPTAEVPVTNIHRQEILNAETLPMGYCAYTPCFRLEAGAYGKDTKGMMRVHQFDKVELVRFATEENEVEEHEKLLQHAEKVFQKLGLKYRVVLLAAGDLGFSAAKCYDIEVWAPGSEQWLEASSCSRFGDFQARRMQLRYKEGEEKPKLVRTLNGSGVALARTFIALIETYQNSDGTIRIPEVLQPYMRGKKLIEPVNKRS